MKKLTEKLGSDSYDRPVRQVHLKDRKKLSGHLPPEAFNALSKCAKSLNCTKSWLVLNWIIEGLIAEGFLGRDARAHLSKQPTEPAPPAPADALRDWLGQIKS